MEQFYYDNYDSSSGVDINFSKESSPKFTETYDKQPHCITNLNNFNYLSSNHHTNYNTINQSSARDILQELKYYERFASSDNRQVNQLNFNSYAADRHQLNTFNGTNYSQNIVNYNNSYYKINNINNFTCPKNQSSSSSQCYQDYQQSSIRKGSNENYELTYTKNKRMDQDEHFAENSQLMKKTSQAASERQTDVTNVGSSSVKNHTVIPHPYNNIDDDDNQEFSHQQNFQFQESQNNKHPIYRSQHFSQVSFIFCKTFMFNVV